MTESIAYRLLSDCPTDDAVRAWNDGFEGYLTDMTVTTASLESRMRQDGIVADASIVAFAGDRPVGIVLNAIGDVQGICQAWNGGTAVATAYRGTGVARELMRRTLALYGERAVRRATLEALIHNSRAIALYEKSGYRTIGTLHGLVADHPGVAPVAADVAIEFTAPERLARIPFYRNGGAWSTLWPNARGAVAVIASRNGSLAGYVLFRRMSAERPGTQIICILQAEASDDGTALSAALSALIAHHRGSFAYRAYNIPGENQIGLEVLHAAGFAPAWEQVWMVRELD
jgi:ribosomal protein S18 acetylase RimI-like enzyme